MQTMYFIGLDAHRRTISYWVKEGGRPGGSPCARSSLQRSLVIRSGIYFFYYLGCSMPLGRSKEPLLALFPLPWGLEHGNLSLRRHRDASIPFGLIQLAIINEFQYAC